MNFFDSADKNLIRYLMLFMDSRSRQAMNCVNKKMNTIGNSHEFYVMLFRQLCGFDIAPDKYAKEKYKIMLEYLSGYEKCDAYCKSCAVEKYRILPKEAKTEKDTPWIAFIELTFVYYESEEGIEQYVRALELVEKSNLLATRILFRLLTNQLDKGESSCEQKVLWKERLYRLADFGDEEGLLALAQIHLSCDAQEIVQLFGIEPNYREGYEALIKAASLGYEIPIEEAEKIKDLNTFLNEESPCGSMKSA